MLDFSVPHSVQEKCECPDRKYRCTYTFSTYFRPTKRLVVTIIVDGVRLLYIETDKSRCLPNFSHVIILSCLFSAVYRLPLLSLCTFFRCDKLVLGVLARDRRWIAVGFITAEFTIQWPLAGINTSAKFTVQLPRVRLITSANSTMQWPLAGIIT